MTSTPEIPNLLEKNGLGIGFARLMPEVNSDLKVVNAARVSFHKTSKVLGERDSGLIGFLARNNHWTPFGHCRTLIQGNFDVELIMALLEQGSAYFKRTDDTGIAPFQNVKGTTVLMHGLLTFSLAHTRHRFIPTPMTEPFRKSCPVSMQALRGDDEGPCPVQEASWTLWPEMTPVTFHLRMPIFVARQWMRSNGGIVYNEVSRRYVDDAPLMHSPEMWRGRPEGSIKQGSGKHIDSQEDAGNLYFDAMATVEDCYEGLLKLGVAPEQARICLPQSTYTEFWMTAPLQALARIISLRIDPHAQWEIRMYAEAVNNLLTIEHGVLWTKLLETQRKTHGNL